MTFVFSCLTLIFSGPSKVNPEAVWDAYKGYAYDLEGGELLYSEEHHKIIEDGVLIGCQVVYRDPNDKVFARKQLDFQHGLTQPSFRLEDTRIGYVEGVRRDGPQYILFNREKPGADSKETAAKKVTPLVIDAGFDHFVREQWDRLIKGGKIEFYFAAPKEQGCFRFRLVKVKDDTYEGRPAVRLKMELDNLLYRALSDPIYLTYEIESKRLARYEGISNISDPKGKSYNARIEFPTKAKITPTKADSSISPRERSWLGGLSVNGGR